MSAAFGMVTNPTAKPVRIIGAYSSYAKAVQLHEVVAKDGAMVMQQKTGGFAIPAGGMLELKPGGNHLMFVGITKPITAGRDDPGDPDHRRRRPAAGEGARQGLQRRQRDLHCRGCRRADA